MPDEHFRRTIKPPTKQIYAAVSVEMASRLEELLAFYNVSSITKLIEMLLQNAITHMDQQRTSLDTPTESS